jgi:predicted small lipoprotein YifL
MRVSRVFIMMSLVVFIASSVSACGKVGPLSLPATTYTGQ